jgi:hypothetical protein
VKLDPAEPNGPALLPPKKDFKISSAFIPPNGFPPPKGSPPKNIYSCIFIQ